MMIEYARVTRSSDSTIDCIGSRTNRTYTQVEYIEDSSSDCPPKVDEVGIIMEIGNAEVVWIGRLKQFKTSTAPTEYRIQPGQSVGISFTGIDPSTNEVSIYKANITASGKGTNIEYTYTITEEISIKDNGSIILQRIDANTAITSSKIEINNNDQITLSNSNFSIVANASGALSINANSTININSPAVYINGTPY